MNEEYIFKEGDVVKLKNSCTNCNEGEICTLHFGTKTGSDIENLFAWGAGGNANCSCKYNWVLITKSTNTIMGNIIDKVRKMRLQEPEKSFVKAGIANTDGTLTAEGKQLFDEWIFEQNKVDFNDEVVQPLLDEMAEEGE